MQLDEEYTIFPRSALILQGRGGGGGGYNSREATKWGQQLIVEQLVTSNPLFSSFTSLLIVFGFPESVYVNAGTNSDGLVHVMTTNNAMNNAIYHEQHTIYLKLTTNGHEQHELQP